jgi:hypothetical protein
MGNAPAPLYERVDFRKRPEIMWATMYFSDAKVQTKFRMNILSQVATGSRKGKSNGKLVNFTKDQHV